MAKEVKLIGRFTGKLTDGDEDFEHLGYNFEAVTLEDFENGEIKGIEYNGETFFTRWNDKDLYLEAYTIGNLEEYTEEEIEQMRYEHLSKEEQNFLNSLEEGDVITFSVTLPNISVWDFKRYEDKYAEDELKQLFKELTCTEDEC